MRRLVLTDYHRYVAIVCTYSW